MSGDLSAGPTYPSAVLGVRKWRASRGPISDPDHKLRPISYLHSGPWVRGVNTFRCRDGHSEPEESCECGLYATHLPVDPKRWERSLRRRLLGSGWDEITGVVRGSGSTRVHASGFRSERAEIIALLIDPVTEPIGGSRAAGLERRYGVPVFYDPRSLSVWLSGELGSGRISAAPAPAEARPAKSFRYWGAWAAFWAFSGWLTTSLYGFPIFAVLAALAVIPAWSLALAAVSFMIAVYLVAKSS